MVFEVQYLGARKRGRDDDEEGQSSILSQVTAKRNRNSADGLSIFTQHWPSSRPSLPLRDSFSLRPQIDSPQMIESPDAESPPGTALSSPIAQSSPLPAEPLDTDMMEEGGVIVVESTTPPSPYTTHSIHRPPKLSPQNTTACQNERFAGGRIPTPIYGSFPSIAQLPPPRTSGGIFTPYPPPPRLPVLSTTVQSLQRRDHVMPSPVRECDDEMEAEYAFAGSQLSRLSFSSATAGHMDDPYNTNRIDTDDTNGGNSEPRRQDDHGISPLSTSPCLPAIATSRANEQTFSPGLMSPPLLSPTTGRKRSGAITSFSAPDLSMETQAKAKKFFFGFRDDCDKCRARVAGHFAHFL